MRPPAQNSSYKKLSPLFANYDGTTKLWRNQVSEESFITNYASCLSCTTLLFLKMRLGLNYPFLAVPHWERLCLNYPFSCIWSEIDMLILVWWLQITILPLHCIRIYKNIINIEKLAHYLPCSKKLRMACSLLCSILICFSMVWGGLMFESRGTFIVAFRCYEYVFQSIAEGGWLLVMLQLQK